jgi:phage terminase small subunit
MKLTQKQEGFVLSILEGKSQIDAYKANYNCENMKDETIYSRASRLMKEYKISARLDTLRNEKATESKWTLDKLIDEFVAVKEKCMQEEPVMKFDKQLGEYVETGEYVFKESGVIKALENIGKLLGHYTDKVEVTEKHIVVDIEEDDEE